MNRTNKKSDSYHIAIIGFGPKGLYGLERLLAHLKNCGISHPVVIHLFNRSEYFGPGEVYRMDHPDYLVMNYSNHNISMWPDRAPAPVVSSPNTLTDWLIKRFHTPAHEVNNQFSSRATIGHYLTEGFEDLLCHCPGNCTIKKFKGNVIDLTRYKGDWFVHMKNRNGTVQSPGPYQELLLTTGHTFPGKESIINKEITFTYPVQNQLASVTAKETIAIKGMGLTFIDAVLALTEGRGGTFSSVGGVLSYHSSGNEPFIIPYSLSGTPMFPRKSSFGLPQRQLLFFPNRLNEQAFAKLKGKKIDFIKDLLPLIYHEILFAYYRVIFRQKGLQFIEDADFRIVRNQINEFQSRYPTYPAIHVDKIFSPLPKYQRDHHQSVIGYMKSIGTEAEKGEEESPLATAVATWRHINAWMPPLYNYGRFTPGSHLRFLREYVPRFNRMSYGPPLINHKKILAIAEAGLLDFSFAQNPSVDWNAGRKIYQLTNRYDQTCAQWHLDARIPGVTLNGESPSLYTNLLSQGLLRPFINTNENGEYFQPGCMDLNEQGHPVSASGEILTSITAYGTPTEGVTFDNDTLSTNRNDFVSAWAQRIGEKLIGQNNVYS